MGKRAEAAIPFTKPSNKLKVRIDDLYTFQPLTQSQEHFYDLYAQKITAIMLHGVAGTGKTFIALYKALEEVLDPSSKVKQIYIVRSAVQGRELGHLPGDVDEKTECFKQPYKELCHDFFGPKQQAFERLEEQGVIQFVTTSFLRGVTQSNAIIIVDEAQNLNWQEISTIMTRVGQNARIIFCGDFRQTDLNRKHDMSGLKKFLAVTHHMPSFRNIEFGVEDIVRSDIVKEFVLATMQYDDTHEVPRRGSDN